MRRTGRTSGCSRWRPGVIARRRGCSAEWSAAWVGRTGWPWSRQAEWPAGTAFSSLPSACLQPVVLVLIGDDERVARPPVLRGTRGGWFASLTTSRHHGPGRWLSSGGSSRAASPDSGTRRAGSFSGRPRTSSANHLCSGIARSDEPAFACTNRCMRAASRRLAHALHRRRGGRL
jgi:hypothetical protein